METLDARQSLAFATGAPNHKSGPDTHKFNRKPGSFSKIF
jgi:hypothetical protein